MHPEDEIEEALLISAFKKRQQIEMLKTRAIIAATVNPEKAHEAFMEYMRALMPEYDAMRDKMDEHLAGTFDREHNKAFVISGTRKGFGAMEIDVENAVV